MFEQYFYDSSIKFKLNSEVATEINAGGPFRKPRGGAKILGNAEYEIKKRKVYTVTYTGKGVLLSIPEDNLRNNKVSGIKLVKAK